MMVRARNPWGYSQEELIARVDSLTQQLAAAKEYAERLRESLETAQEHVEFSVGYVHASLAGYKPHVHEQADKDLAQVAAALALQKPWEKA